MAVLSLHLESFGEALDASQSLGRRDRRAFNDLRKRPGLNGGDSCDFGISCV
jgi:hypothetical protein